MIIFIDGYNFLKGAGYHYYHGRKSHFITICIRYAHKKGHNLIIVFDGGPWTKPVIERYKKCEVVETGESMSADDYLIKRIAETHAAEMVLVTADRGIISALSSSQAIAVAPHVFCEIVSAYENSALPTGQKNAPIQKLHSEEDEELDNFMAEISTAIYTKDTAYAMIKDVKKKKIGSKKDRALRKILSKL